MNYEVLNISVITPWDTLESLDEHDNEHYHDNDHQDLIFEIVDEQDTIYSYNPNQFFSFFFFYFLWLFDKTC